MKKIIYILVTSILAYIIGSIISIIETYVLGTNSFGMVLLTFLLLIFTTITGVIYQVYWKYKQNNKDFYLLVWLAFFFSLCLLIWFSRSISIITSKDVNLISYILLFIHWFVASFANLATFYYVDIKYSGGYFNKSLNNPKIGYFLIPFVVAGLPLLILLIMMERGG